MNAALARLDWQLLAAEPAGESRLTADLVARARRGDPSAFEEIVRRHQRQVYNLAYRMLRQPEEAEDATQDAFLNAFASLPQLSDHAALETWICRIAVRLCLTRLRSPGRHAEVALDPEELPPTYPADTDLVHDVRQALAQLSPKYRLAVTVFYLEGRSYQEAARLLGINVRTLKTQLYRARLLLRDLLRPACEEDKL